MRSRFGRAWMVVRDMDVAAEIVGIPPLRTKLLAFAVSSCLCGVAGALLVFLYLESAETLAFDVNVSFLVLFMIIFGGMIILFLIVEPLGLARLIRLTRERLGL